MLENLIVALIVGAAVFFAVMKYAPASWRRRAGLAKDAGCGSGCDSCDSCETPAQTDPRVIKLHRTK